MPSDPPRDVTVGAAVEGREHVYASPGRVEFSVDGVPLALTVFNGRRPGSLLALFTDETSGVATYAANRSLTIDPPAADGAVVLDFTRATNLPCAYTEFATCPLPASPRGRCSAPSRCARRAVGPGTRRRLAAAGGGRATVGRCPSLNATATRLPPWPCTARCWRCNWAGARSASSGRARSPMTS
nr:DUF1684 domain-containing protein [Actinoplanes sp. N902-109]